MKRLLALLLISCASNLSAQGTCDDLRAMTVPATAIGLPTRGATVHSSELVHASAAGVDSAGGFSDEVREYCKVLGWIAPIDPNAPPIGFRVNLPTRWNGKALQYGGGGYNGSLGTALGRAAGTTPGTLTPLAQGYLTYGTDGGHQNEALSEIQAFALNEEALVNFAYASYKKVRDVAVAIAEQRYGRAPARIYYMGGSEGGREGLMMAQRFPADYDGVLANVPVINWVGLGHAQARNGPVQLNGGWMDSARVALLDSAVRAACDALDGLVDGIVSDYMGCRTAFDPQLLRCSAGASESDCLTDRQIAAVTALHSPYTFPVELANGIRAYPAFGYGGEGQPAGIGAWITGRQQPTFPAARGQGIAWIFGNGMLRYFVMRDSSANPLTYSPDRYTDRLQELSALLDATDPDLSAFAARGGKLIMKEHMADHAQSPYAGTEYYESVVARFGQGRTDDFVRLYVTPGANHAGGGLSALGQRIPSNVDLLTALDRWVESGIAPAKTLVQTAVSSTPPYDVIASRPMCSYPQYPRYRGTGDATRASSFECVDSSRTRR